MGTTATSTACPTSRRRLTWRRATAFTCTRSRPTGFATGRRPQCPSRSRFAPLQAQAQADLQRSGTRRCAAASASRQSETLVQRLQVVGEFELVALDAPEELDSPDTLGGSGLDRIERIYEAGREARVRGVE